MVGFELVAGYLAAWAVQRLRHVGTRLNQETDQALDAGLDRLHDAVARKLGADPALRKLDDEVSRGLKPSDRTLRRVQDAVEEAAEDDPRFAATIEALMVRLAETSRSTPTVTDVDLRAARGVQLGNYNSQTNTFR